MSRWNPCVSSLKCGLNFLVKSICQHLYPHWNTFLPEPCCWRLAAFLLSPPLWAGIKKTLRLGFQVVNIVHLGEKEEDPIDVFQDPKAKFQQTRKRGWSSCRLWILVKKRHQRCRKHRGFGLGLIGTSGTLHNVLFVDFDSLVSKIAPVSATGLYICSPGDLEFGSGSGESVSPS